MTEFAQKRGLLFKTAIIWLSILVLATFLIAGKAARDSVRLYVIPEVPQAEGPIVATFILSNPSARASTTTYELYINGQLAESGTTTVAAGSSSTHQHAFKNYLERGEQVNFVLKARSDSGNVEKVVSLPAYPPQVMSSFVSFATFSTSVMSSMISMEYFTTAFGTTGVLNTGLVLTFILIGLLLFLEVTQVATAHSRTRVVVSYRATFSFLSNVLLVIFAGMILTRTVLLTAM